MISGIIFKSLDAGSFRYAVFYSRRIKRIFPSLVTVLVASLMAGWLFLFPSEWRSLGKHVFAGAAFLSNIALMREGGYFDSAVKPLLHLWSLGIEEQFYFVWPLLLVLIWKKRPATLPSILLVLSISFGLNLWSVGRHPSADFYFPAMRVWELALGAILSYATLFRSRMRSSGQWLDWLENSQISFALSLAGMSLLFGSLVFINEYGAFPGGWALLPTTEAFLTIAAGPQAWFNRVALSSRPMVFLGLISYPLYLWHWPILVFTKILTPAGITWPIAATAIMASIAASYLTYRFVETPLRHHRSAVAVPWLLAFAVGGVGLLGLAGREIIRPRLCSSGALVEAAIADWDYPFNSNYSRSNDFQAGSVGGRSDEKILFIGDSHVEQYYPRVKALTASRPDRFPTAVFATYGLCPPLPGIRSRHGFACDKFFDYTMELAGDPLVKTVVFSAYWENYFGYEPNGDKASKIYRAGDDLRTIGPGLPLAAREFKEFGLAIKSLEARGKHVFVILSNPTSPLYDPRNMVSHWTGEFRKKDLDRKALENARPILDRLEAAATQSGATVIDPAPYLCAGSICKTTTQDGLPLYKDENHLRNSCASKYATFVDQVYTH